MVAKANKVLMMMRQSQPDGKVRFPHFRYSCTLAASLVLGVLCVSSAQEPAKAKKPDSGRRKILFEDTLEVYRKPAREVFGEKSLPPVITGLLILDGEYVSPPYRLSRRGNYLLINSHEISKYSWPPHWICISNLKPNIPDDLLKNAKYPGDIKLNSRIIANLRIDRTFCRADSYYDLLSGWIRLDYLPKEGVKQLAEVTRKYPFVSHVEILTPPDIGMIVHFRDGNAVPFRIIYPSYDAQIHIPGHKSIAMAMDAQLASLHSDLSAGNLVLWDSTWLALWDRSPEDVLCRGHAADRIPPAKLRSKLPKVVEIINQDTPLKKRAWAVLVSGFVRSTDMARAFIKAFTTDPEFRRRLNALAKPRP